MKVGRRFSLFNKILLLISLFLLNMGLLFSSDYYWDKPSRISVTEARFPLTLDNGKDSYVFWEEIDTKNQRIYLSGRRYTSATKFIELNRVAGPFSYSGNEVPDIYTAAISKDGTVSLAALSGDSQISIFTTKDKGKKFYETKLETSGMMVAPRIYTDSKGHFMLFTSVGESESFSIYCSESENGLFWPKFEQFKPTKTFRNPFIPVLGSVNNIDIVVFQSQYTIPESRRTSYQLFLTYRKNGNWSEPVLLTNEKSLSSMDSTPFYKYQNQRPYLYDFNGHMYISWERTGSVNSDIWVAEIDENGIKDFTAEQISSDGNASRGILFSYDNKLHCSWFDTRTGRESIYMAEKTGAYWEESTLVENSATNLFSHPLILNHDGKDILTFVWQKVDSKNHSSIQHLTPDITAAPPILKPLTYRKGKKSRSEDVEIQIEFPEDASDFSGYSYTWEKDNEVTPSKDIMGWKKARDNKIKIKTKAPEEGEYYLSVRIVDYAGNWSEPAVISYTRDLTPPVPPVLRIEDVDDYGFMASNNYSLKWDESVSDDVASYYYRIEYLEDIPKEYKVSSRHPLKVPPEEALKAKDEITKAIPLEDIERISKKVTKGVHTSSLTTSRYYNQDNGVYLFSVAAVDEVGNISEPSNQMFILNKFEPSTYITGVTDPVRNEDGDFVLSIYGGGFTYNGTISEIYIDRDGKAPYDLVLKKKNKDYKVVSDRRILNVNIGSDIEEGRYKIGLRHTDRGVYFTKNILPIDEYGTVKIENEYKVKPGITTDFTHYKYIITHNEVIIILLAILLILIVLFIIVSVKNSAYERHLNNLEIQALLGGKKMPLLKKDEKKKHLPSLKGKLIRFTFAIIIIVVTVVTIQNGYKSIQLQSKTMAEGLLTKTEVLMESLNSGVKNFLPDALSPDRNITELSALPKQKEAMEEVNYITILGEKYRKEGEKEVEGLDYVWATNDEYINEKINSSQLVAGESKITEPSVGKLTSDFALLEFNIQNAEKVYSSDIDKLEEEALKLALSGREEDIIKSEQMSEGKIKKLRNERDERLSGYSEIKSKPSFNPDNLDFNNTNYMFYKPVIYKGTGDNYIHSVILLEISTKNLIDSITAEKNRILIMGIVIAIIAVILGIFGSYIFASLIVKPIKKLENHVIMIGQTKNKANLKGKDVVIKSKDEVGRLGDAINAMTHELVLNAEEEELAMDGKAVQKAFLPLADSALNMKNTIAEYQDENLQIYGYYEGESGVSGDYFDYKKLDDQWYGMIKCDASGHGIPAAIIMTVVATIFRRYFENWSFKKNGTKLNVLVEQINDFIEGLGLKGKFATLIICLLNVRTGELYMCNAGDNLVHIFDGKTKKIKVITLKSVPTAGVFTSDLVAMRGGFIVEKTILNKGDTLFLYTDGIEESNRRIREVDFSVRQNEVEVKKFNPKTKTEETQTKFEDAKEEFGPERVSEIIESVYNKKKYILTKEDNPVQDEVLEFNFEKCEGTVKDTILALASLEKVFRLYKPDNVQQTDYIKIDKKIDEFLSKYFNKYDYYAANKTEALETSNYIDYDMMLEDEQSDDLTMLAIKRI